MPICDIPWENGTSGNFCEKAFSVFSDICFDVVVMVTKVIVAEILTVE
jgi:hypothetical protein